MPKKKINPRRRPATQADVRRAKDAAVSEAAGMAWSILFMVLADKEGYDLEGLRRVWDEVNDLSDSIAQGYCTVRDIREILEIEIGAKLV